MEDQDKMIKAGDDCEEILKSKPFNRVINGLVESTFQKFTNSKPEEQSEREVTYYHYRALVDVVNTLKQQVAVRDEIIAKQQEDDDNSQEEQ